MNVDSLLKLSVAILISMAGHSIAGAASPGGTHGFDETDVASGVIFSSRVAEANRLCTRPSVCWTPTPNDIAMLEKELPRYLRLSGEPGASAIWQQLASYKRKYFGYEVRGKRWILVIGMCGKYWRRAAPNFRSPQRPVTDMGSCYFSAEYSVKRRKFADLFIDGEA